MRETYNDELNNLHALFSQMGMMANEAVYLSVKAFINHDKDMAKQVIRDDKVINDSELKLEKKCFEFIALQQPVTTDLRMIVTFLKASSDLEKMGDNAVSIAKSTIRMKGNKRLPKTEDDIAKMAQTVKKMVEDVLLAYSKGDSDAAYAIASEDQKLDESSRRIYNDCIQSMKEDSENIVVGTDYMLVASFLERIGDSVTNICEWIVYFSTGKLLELNPNAQED